MIKISFVSNFHTPLCRNFKQIAYESFEQLKLMSTYFTDEFCEEYPHNLIPTPGYWIECSRQKIATDTIWDESESEHDSGPDADGGEF